MTVINETQTCDETVGASDSAKFEASLLSRDSHISKTIRFRGVPRREILAQLSAHPTEPIAGLQSANFPNSQIFTGSADRAAVAVR